MKKIYVKSSSTLNKSKYIPLITKRVDLFPFGDKDSTLTNHPGYVNMDLTLKPEHQDNPLFIKVKNCTRNPKQDFNKFIQPVSLPLLCC